METIDCIKTRRSIRKYKDKVVPEGIINEIIECGQRAPSAHNTQPWAFVIVREKEKLEKLSKTHQWAPFVKDAQLCIVLCCTKTESVNKSAMHMSVACAAQNMLLAIHNFGLGSCWTYIHNLEDTSVEQKVRDILEIPKNVDVICMLPIGYPNQVRSEKEIKNRREVVHDGKW